jgi:hypothetical protein
MEKDALEAAIGALESSIRTIDFWVLIFAIAVAASLTFEAVFSVAHFLKDRKLPPLRAELACIHAKESLNLEGDVADAKERAAKAELALERFKAPRTISLEQQSKMVSEIKSFAGIEFDASTSIENTEQLRLLISLTETLSKAGWKQIDWRYAVAGMATYKVENNTSPDIGIAAADNVQIQVHRESLERLKPAAEAFAQLLNAIDIKAEATVLDRNTQNTGNVQAIHLIIGQKSNREQRCPVSLKGRHSFAARQLRDNRLYIPIPVQ